MIKESEKAFEKSSLFVEVGDDKHITAKVHSPIVLDNASSSENEVTRYAIADASLNVTDKEKKEVSHKGKFCFYSDSNKLFTYKNQDDFKAL